MIVLASLLFVVFYLAMVGFTHSQVMRLHRPRCAKCQGTKGRYGPAYSHTSVFPDPDMGTPWIISAVWPLTLLAALMWVFAVRPTSLGGRWMILAGNRFGTGRKADQERIAELERELGIQ